MNVLIVLGHPDENSFNHAIAEVCRKKLTEKGHSVIFHDLYKEDFDPVIHSAEIHKNGKFNDVIRKHCDDLVASDAVIVVHPNWWGQPPAILKGWIDRVIRPGIAYEFVDNDKGEGVPVGLLKARVALVFNTSNTGENREMEIFKDPLETIWKNCIFGLCGVKVFERKMFRIIVTGNFEQRRIWLGEVETVIDKYFPENN